MAKKTIPSISELSKYLQKDKLLPLYFLCGEDAFTIDLAVAAIEKNISDLILSDFDRESFNADKNITFAQVNDLALSFPFGGGKKLIILKNFEKLADKKDLASYAVNPPEFTTLVITNAGKIADAGKEPYSILVDKNYMFEARPLTGDDLVEWLIKEAKKKKVILNNQQSRLIIEIVGEDKILLEHQLNKLADFLNGKTELSEEDIKKITSPTKEFSIFDLLDSLGKGDKSKTLLVGLNLLKSGAELIYIINMLAKFMTTIATIHDLTRQRINDNDGCKAIGVSYYYYLNCKKAKYFLNDDRLANAAKALLNADISVKSTSASSETILEVLIVELLEQVASDPFNKAV